MKGNKYKVLVSIISIIMLITIINIPKLLINKSKEKLPEVKLKEIEKNDTFAIMVPNEKNDGYTSYDGSEWPKDEDDYFYSYSECIDNNGNRIDNVLEYDEGNNTALITTNSTVYCTLYFDKYNYMYVPTHNIIYNSAGNTTPVPVYMSSKIKKIEFVDHIKEELDPSEKDVSWWDLSDTSKSPKGSVIAWTEPIQGDASYDTLYIGSKTKIRVLSLAVAFRVGEYDRSTTVQLQI